MTDLQRTHGVGPTIGQHRHAAMAGRRAAALRRHREWTAADRPRRQAGQFSQRIAYNGIASFVLSPDGRQLAFVDTPQPIGTNAFGPLYLLDLEDQIYRQLSEDPVVYFAPGTLRAARCITSLLNRSADRYGCAPGLDGGRRYPPGLIPPQQRILRAIPALRRPVCAES
ncbi:MAG: hypothetical protein R2856_26370 [Caldilineaceae bacterium]